jgi:N-acyl-phosphatidylethanolamine-hydrolysing phospholipase D
MLGGVAAARAPPSASGLPARTASGSPLGVPDVQAWDSSAEVPRHVVRRGVLGGRSFSNPWPAGGLGKGPGEVFRLLRTPRPAVASAGELSGALAPVAYDVAGAAAQRAGDPLRATWISHATVLVQVGGRVVLTDPVFGRAGPFESWGPVARFAPPPVAAEGLGVRVDVVLISHLHYDHLSLSSARTINKQAGGPPLWVVPLGLRSLIERTGARDVVELGWWDSIELAAAGPGGGGGGAPGAAAAAAAAADNTDDDAGAALPLRVTMIPAQHWSSRYGWDRNATLWGGFVVASARERFLFAGDTGYVPGLYKQVRELLGPIDLAALPIGAYAPRSFMADQHCDPEEAVKMHLELGAARSLAIHWGTFPMAWDGPLEAPRLLVRAARRAGAAALGFEVLRHGESVVLGRARSVPCCWLAELDAEAIGEAKGEAKGAAGGPDGAGAAPGRL